MAPPGREVEGPEPRTVPYALRLGGLGRRKAGSAILSSALQAKKQPDLDWYFDTAATPGREPDHSVPGRDPVEASVQPCPAGRCASAGRGREDRLVVADAAPPRPQAMQSESFEGGIAIYRGSGDTRPGCETLQSWRYYLAPPARPRAQTPATDPYQAGADKDDAGYQGALLGQVRGAARRGARARPSTVAYLDAGSSRDIGLSPRQSRRLVHPGGPDGRRHVDKAHLLRRRRQDPDPAGSSTNSSPPLRHEEAQVDVEGQRHRFRRVRRRGAGISLG